MKKIFTVLAANGDETEKLKDILNHYHIKEEDMDISKVFNIQGHELVYFAIVTDEKTFRKITKSINGTRIY